MNVCTYVPVYECLCYADLYINVHDGYHQCQTAVVKKIDEMFYPVSRITNGRHINNNIIHLIYSMPDILILVELFYFT